jgi:hypothetical protein
MREKMTKKKNKRKLMPAPVATERRKEKHKGENRLKHDALTIEEHICV